MLQRTYMYPKCQQHGLLGRIYRKTGGVGTEKHYPVVDVAHIHVCDVWFTQIPDILQIKAIGAHGGCCLWFRYTFVLERSLTARVGCTIRPSGCWG